MPECTEARFGAYLPHIIIHRTTPKAVQAVKAVRRWIQERRRKAAHVLPHGGENCGLEAAEAEAAEVQWWLQRAAEVKHGWRAATAAAAAAWTAALRRSRAARRRSSAL